MSHIDYANGLLINIPNSSLEPFQRLQNMCAKLVLKKNKYSSSMNALYDLHWLPIQARIDFKILTIVHTCLYGDAPDYLKELLKKKQKPKRTLRSNTSNHIDLDLIIPFNSKKTFGDQSFSFMGPYLWNNLPYNLKSIVQYDNFKRKCKTFLFRKYFNC